MSAFLVSTRHTVAVAYALVARGLADDIVGAAIALRSMNNAALSARYGDRHQAEPLEAIRGLLMPADLDQAATVNTLARCLSYQCAEGDVPETHPAAPMLAALIQQTGGEQAELVSGLWGI